MYIEVKRVECTLEPNEVSTLAYALMKDLRCSVETHWVKFGGAAFMADADVRIKLRLMEQFFSIEGRHDLYRMYLDEFTKHLESKGDAK